MSNDDLGMIDADRYARIIRVGIAMFTAFIGVSAWQWRAYGYIDSIGDQNERQDDNIRKLRDMIREQSKQIKDCQAVQLETIELLVNDLAILRDVTLHLAPKNRRDELRKNFEAQRMHGIKVLVQAKTRQ